MAGSTSKKSLFFNLCFILLGLMVLGVSIIASVPTMRTYVRGLVQKPYREILAKSRGDMNGEGLIVNAIKIKTQDGISVEVFERITGTDEERLLARLHLDEKRDAHFNIRGRPTNLALMDIDSDGLLELIVPVYDENLIPRLHVFRFDPIARVFIKLGPEAANGLGL